MVMKITMKKRNKRDENEGEPGSRKGKCFGVDMGIYIQVHVLAMDFCKFFLIDRFRIYCTFGTE